MTFMIPKSDFEGDDGLKAWLDSEGVETREGKGKYQLLQVYSGSKFGWQVIHRSDHHPDHCSINPKLIPLVRKFLAQRKENVHRRSNEGS